MPFGSFGPSGRPPGRINQNSYSLEQSKVPGMSCQVLDGVVPFH